MNPPLQKILYLEDDPDIQAIALMALEEIGGYRVLACDRGADALEQAEAFDPDLLILDVMMPEMDGPTTLTRLREIPAIAATPAIFMTAKAQTREVEAYRAQGAVAVITKPFEPMELPSQVAAIWEDCHGR